MIRLLSYIKNYWVTFTILTLIGITVLSLWPLDTFPRFPGTDKTHHLIAYSILMFPAALRKPNKWLFLGILFIAYSGVIELLQPYVNRYGEWLDFATNAIGVACGYISAEVIKYLFPITTSRSQELQEIKR